MSRIPRDKALDSTFALLSDGYTFISKRCRRYGSDIFETRLMLHPVFCMLGEEAAHVFYQPGRFTRVAAMPRPTLELLQGQRSVQTLDGEAHRRRKRMFMSLMIPAAIRRLADLAEEEWHAAIRRWTARGKIVLLDEAQEILCRAVCRWAGLPLTDAEAERRTREFAAMIDGAGAVGPRSWRAMLLRRRSERWMESMVDNVRAGSLEPPESSAAHVISWHRNPDGQLLKASIAAVELINVLRPTVAVAHYVMFGAVALHEHPECRQAVRAGDDGHLELFTHEVRRLYPFFPCIGGPRAAALRPERPRFPRGDLDAPRPVRDRSRSAGLAGAAAFPPGTVPRMGQESLQPDPAGRRRSPRRSSLPRRVDHDRAGEKTDRLLTTTVRYDVPEQDLRIDLSRMPALPASRFAMAEVRAAA